MIGVTPSGLVRDLLPPGVAVAEAPIEAVDGWLWPEEAEQVAQAAAGRRADFTAGRVLARRALRALGGPHGPIRRGDDGAPEWPPGFTGSISHCAHHAVAAVARLNPIAGVGVDIEEVQRLTDDLEDYMFTPAEISRNLAGHEAGRRQSTAAVMFCAKEAYYKAQRPLTGRFLGFQDVELDLDHATGDFEVWRVARPDSRCAGRFAIRHGLAAAALWIAQEAAAGL